MRIPSYLVVFFFCIGCSLSIEPDPARLGPDLLVDAGTDTSVDAPIDRDQDIQPDGAPDASPPDASPDSGRPDMALDNIVVPMCSSPARCDGDQTLVRCENGIETPEMCPFACREDRCVNIVPSNVRPELVDRVMGSLTVSNANGNENNYVVIDTTNCVIRPGNIRGLLETQADASLICVFSLENLEVEEGGGLVAFGDHPVALLSPNAIDIRGFVSVSAVGGDLGAGSAEGGNGRNPQGSGSEPGSAGQHDNEFDDGGGGGGGFCGQGGNGGRGQDARGGPGGNGIGSSELSPLRGGSGGGVGPGFTDQNNSNSGFGGASGGALQLFSRVEIRLPGGIFATGGSGGATNLPIPMRNAGSGGGGGSGGGVLIETPNLTGQGFISVAGGGGGGGYGQLARGESGQEGFQGDPIPQGGSGGRVHGGQGGNGAGGSNLDGSNGENIQNRPTRVGNGGGGGGGGGCIVFRTGQASPVTVSPADALNRLTPRVQ